MYKDYMRGLQALKNLLPEEAQDDFAVYEARLMENLHRERLFGGNEITRSERAIITDGLNKLANDYNVTNFNELSYQPQTGKKMIDAIPAKPALTSEYMASTRQAIKREPLAPTTPPNIT